MERNCLVPWLRSLAERKTGIALELASRERGSERLSFPELDEKSRTFAAGFASLGLKPGDSVALWLPNGPLWMAAHFGAALAGITTIPLNTWYRESEVEHFLALGEVALILVDSQFHGIAFGSILDEVIRRGNCPSLRWIVDVAGKIHEFPGVAVAAMKTLEHVDPPADQALGENETMIGFATSGTTGMSKLAVHRESALIAHGNAVARRAAMGPGDVVLGALPPCGAYGYTLLMASLAAGARAIQLDRLDLDHLVEVIERERVTIMAVTEPIIRDLLDHPRATPSSLSSLRLVFSAGGTLRPVVERAKREFGFTLTNVYGSSEVLALAAFWDADEDIETRSAAGGALVSDGMEVSVVDPSGALLGPSAPGELRFRGPVLTSGYLKNGAATEASFTPDGWFLSKDLGQLVEGSDRRFRYIARMTDALRLKGFLVNPGEIEARLQAHPAVVAAQVVGVPDGKGEDRAIAFVTVERDAAVSVEDLRLFCRSGMASYKTPAAIRIIDQFPTTRSANGDKIVKHRLREMAQELELE